MRIPEGVKPQIVQPTITRSLSEESFRLQMMVKGLRTIRIPKGIKPRGCISNRFERLRTMRIPKEVKPHLLFII